MTWGAGPWADKPWGAQDASAGASLDLAASTLAITGTVTASGDIQIGTSFDLAASSLSVSGSLTPTGDIQSAVDPTLDVSASALSITGSITAAGDIQIGTSFNLSASPISVAGVLSATGDVAASTSSGATAAEIWSYTLSNGLTAEETVVQTHSMLTALTAAMATCPADLTLALKLLRNKQITNQATGKMTVYDDDGSTVLVEGNLFEDAAGTTAYRGQGAERRERLA